MEILIKDLNTETAPLSLKEKIKNWLINSTSNINAKNKIMNMDADEIIFNVKFSDYSDHFVISDDSVSFYHDKFYGLSRLIHDITN